MTLAKEAFLVDHAAGADLRMAEKVAVVLDVECCACPGREGLVGRLWGGG